MAAAEQRPPRAKGPRRVTWRVAIFLLLVVVILGGGLTAIGYYARGTYYVGFDGDRVTVFQGKPGGVLWFEPTVIERTTFTRSDVRPELVDQHEEGIEIGDRADALTFPRSVTTTTTSSTSTTSTTSSTTTSVVSPAVPPTSTP